MTDRELCAAILDVCGVPYVDRSHSLASPDPSCAWCVSNAPDGEVISYYTRFSWWRGDWWERQAVKAKAPADAEIAPRGMG